MAGHVSIHLIISGDNVGGPSSKLIVVSGAGVISVKIAGGDFGRHVVIWGSVIVVGSGVEGTFLTGREVKWGDASVANDEYKGVDVKSDSLSVSCTVSYDVVTISEGSYSVG